MNDQVIDNCKESPKHNIQLFRVCPDINTEALLAKPSEYLQSISVIASDFAAERRLRQLLQGSCFGLIDRRYFPHAQKNGHPT
jgi:hypothetical protein